MLQLKRQFGLQPTWNSLFVVSILPEWQNIVHFGSTSSKVCIVCSVPRRSVLGPRLFVLYNADLAVITPKHCVSLHTFANNTQLYRVRLKKWPNT